MCLGCIQYVGYRIAKEREQAEDIFQNKYLDFFQVTNQLVRNFSFLC